MTLDLIGNMVLMCGVLAGGILLIVVNVNYSPDDDEEKDEER